MQRADSPSAHPDTVHAVDAGSPGKNGALAALVLVAVMLAGGWQLIGAARGIDSANVPQGWDDFWQGRTTNTLEKQLDTGLPARSTLIAAANGLRYRLTGGANDQVRIGRDGWLFLTDELRHYPNGGAHLAARVALLQGASEALAKDGVKLVVALVPDKARVHAAHLTPGQAAVYAQDAPTRYQDALNALRTGKVATVDVLQAFADADAAASAETAQQHYYSTDTHWNQRGAQVAAQAIALQVRSMQLGLDATEFATAPGGPRRERPGDLLHLMGLAHAPDLLRPRPDWERPQTTRQTSADAAGGLFDDIGVPVVLTGTSYSLRGNFYGYLQQALGAKVLNAAKDGAGFLQATTAYLKDDAYKTAKPKVLIWEVPERFLPGDLDGEAAWLARLWARR
jgi:alginate O-acetyltransferase complex protein AlgJ